MFSLTVAVAIITRLVRNRDARAEYATRRIERRFAALALVSLASFVAEAAAMAPAPPAAAPQRFTATVVNAPGQGTSTLQIVVDRWSTDSESDRLLNTVLERGPVELLDTLREMPPVGYIRTPTSTAWDLRYARSTPLPDGGERIVLATDRPLSFWEQSTQPRTVDYPFTVIELRLNAQGEGEGRLSIATKIIGDKQSGTIVLENYALQKSLLQAVRRQKTV